MNNNQNATHFSKISNIIFLMVSIFCLSFLWCNFYIKNFKISLYSSIIIIASFCIIFVPLYIIKQKHTNFSKNEQLKFEAIKNNLLFSNEIDTLKILSPIINLQNFIKINNHHLYSQKDNKDIFLLFYDDNIFINKLCEIYKSRISNNIIIYCINKPNSKDFIENITLNYIDAKEIYNSLKEKEINFQSNIIIKKKSKLKFKDILYVILSKEKSKSYFWLGILLLFSSMFTPYSIYYIIFSSFLILLAIFCRFNPIFNKKNY